MDWTVLGGTRPREECATGWSAAVPRQRAAALLWTKRTFRVDSACLCHLYLAIALAAATCQCRTNSCRAVPKVLGTRTPSGKDVSRERAADPAPATAYRLRFFLYTCRHAATLSLT